MNIYSQPGIGGIMRMNMDGTKREIFARGIHNSVGMDFNPKDKRLWWTDNQTDTATKACAPLVFKKV